jgi:nicotinamide-nucleotide amidase
MHIALLATGDEILQGDTANSNSQDLSHILHAEGIETTTHLVCGDKEEDIIACLQWLTQKHTLILITGGLGPTSDDRTRFALAKFMQTELLIYPEALDILKKRLQRGGLKMNAGNKQQALFPKNTTLLPNPFGSAVGGYCYWKHILFVLLPGPPRECLPMFHHHVLPMLQSFAHKDKVLLKWRLFGVAEAEIAETLDNALAHLDCQTGFRLEIPYVEFKVRCHETLVDAVKSIIDPLVAPYVIASPEQKASECLKEMIIDQSLPMVIIDKATGGVLQTLLQTPDTFPYLHFQAENSVDLQFELSGLDSYWQKKSHTRTVTLHLKGNYQGKIIQEEHDLAYRSPLIVHYAAEWASFRICEFLRG